MKVAYIFPPPWSPSYPSYAMALFKASTKKLDHEFFGYDLNVDLFNEVCKEDKILWDGQFAVRWSTESDRIIQKYSNFIDSYIDKMLETRIDLYAIYLNVYSRPLAFYIAAKVKEKNPQAGVLMGGPQCFPAYDGINILNNKFVDAVCTGEGDLIWPEILNHFSKNGNLHLNISGISYRKEDGTIIDNGVPKLVSDLNIIPFADYSDIDFSKYGNSYNISIMTSRGCINTCAFCSERPNFYKYRYRNAENIFEEVVQHIYTINKNLSTEGDRKRSDFFLSRLFDLIEKHTFILQRNNFFLSRLFAKTEKYTFLLRKQIIPTISFDDSLINGVPRELEKFCDMVIASGIKFKWLGMALIRKEMTRELLEKMKKAGCFHMSWGIESGCQRVLELMHKRFFTMDLARKVIKLTYEVGIQQSCSAIVGFPGETKDMFSETVEFFKEYKKYFSNVGAQTMMILPNSRVGDNYDEFGINHENAPDYLKWQSKDGNNNYEVRLKRLDMLKAVLDEKIITIDK